MKKRIIGALAGFALLGGALVGCTSDADTVSRNLTHEAERFELQRRILFVNGITDTVLYQVEGRCSLETEDSALAGALEVTCKTGPDEYYKHFLYLSDNVTATVQQLEAQDVSEYHHIFIVKPEALVPNIDVDVKPEDGPGH